MFNCTVELNLYQFYGSENILSCNMNLFLFACWPKGPSKRDDSLYIQPSSLYIQPTIYSDQSIYNDQACSRLRDWCLSALSSWNFFGTFTTLLAMPVFSHYLLASTKVGTSRNGFIQFLGLLLLEHLRLLHVEIPSGSEVRTSNLPIVPRYLSSSNSPVPITNFVTRYRIRWSRDRY